MWGKKTPGISALVMTAIMRYDLWAFVCICRDTLAFRTVGRLRASC